MGTRTPQCLLSPSLWGHPVLEHGDSCPHVHVQTHEHTQAVAFSCPAHHGLLRGSWSHRSQPGPPQTASQGCSGAMCTPNPALLEVGVWGDRTGAGAARPCCKCAQMLRLSWERSSKKNLFIGRARSY